MKEGKAPGSRMEGTEVSELSLSAILYEGQWDTQATKGYCGGR
jgi:hypothetical protein